MASAERTEVRLEGYDTVLVSTPDGGEYLICLSPAGHLYVRERAGVGLSIRPAAANTFTVVPNAK